MHRLNASAQNEREREREGREGKSGRDCAISAVVSRRERGGALRAATGRYQTLFNEATLYYGARTIAVSVSRGSNKPEPG